MKAQSLRRLLTLVDVVLVLGIGGVAAWYCVKVAPAAAASSSRRDWTKDAIDRWKRDSAEARPSPTWSVNEEDFKQLVRPDLMTKDKGPGVWPYVGPVPPKWEPKKVEAAA